MSFNRNACKRLSFIAGIERESNEICDLIMENVDKYLYKLLDKLITLILYSDRKTITVNDIRFIHTIDNNYPNIIIPNNFSKFIKNYTNDKDIHNINHSYAIYTLKTPFQNLVKAHLKRIASEDIRIGKDVLIVLQNITEQFIINILKQAYLFTQLSKRETLLIRDIELALKIINRY